jgi:Class II flagellar assembly regulator
MRATCQPGRTGKIKEISEARRADAGRLAPGGSFCPALTMLQAWRPTTGVKFEAQGFEARSMKVTGPSGIGSSSGARPARGADGEGFRLITPEGAGGASQASSVSGPRGVMGVESLLALQDVGGPMERKRRAVRRAGRILDVLDDIKVGMLQGELSIGDLDRLRRAIRDERDQTEDPQLEAVLDDIELRAAVEMAKLEQASRAA